MAKLKQQIFALARTCPQFSISSFRSYQTAPVYDFTETLAGRGPHHPSSHSHPSVLPPQTPHHWEQLYRPRFQALLVDAAGTLLSPSEPAAEVYLRYAKKYGLQLDAREVLCRYREAYNTPWAESPVRYVGDGRPFWRHIVQQAIGCHNEAMFEDIYEYYARGEAWEVSTGAVEALRRIRSNMGLKTAVVSNFDTRLRRIMNDLGISDLFDAVIVSAEVGAEKPNPRLFEAACDALAVPPEAAIHIGDDRRNDLFGARDAGCYVWLWGADVHNFADVERRLQSGNIFDSLSGV